MVKKRLLPILLAVLLAVSLVPPVRASADEGWSDAFRVFVTDPANESTYTNEYFPPENGVEPGFCLYDFDHDGEPALLAFNGSPALAGRYVTVFTHFFGVSSVGQIGFRECHLYYVDDPAWPGLFCTDGNNGVFRTVYYELNGRTLTEREVPDSEVKGYKNYLTFYSRSQILSMGWDSFFSVTAGTQIASAPKAEDPAPAFDRSDKSWPAVYGNFLLNYEFLNTDLEFLNTDLTDGQAALGYAEPGFCLLDMDRDGVPELIAFNGGPTQITAKTFVFSCVNGEVLFRGSAGEQPYRYENSPYPGFFCRLSTGTSFTVTYYDMGDGEFVSIPVMKQSMTAGGGTDKQQLTRDGELFSWSQDESSTRLVFYSLRQIRAMGWPAFLNTQLWDQAGQTLGTPVQMSAEQQYEANIFLSNFGEQAVFSRRRFDTDCAHFTYLDDLVGFAHLWCAINRPDALGVNQTARGAYFTLPFSEAAEVWQRFFGFSFTQQEAAQYPRSTYLYENIYGPYPSFYDSGMFWFPAASGESYNRLSIVRSMEDLGDGTYRLLFDIYRLDIMEYHKTDGVDTAFYKMDAGTASGDGRLTLEHSGAAVVKPYSYNGRQSWQLLRYQRGVNVPSWDLSAGGGRTAGGAASGGTGSGQDGSAVPGGSPDTGSSASTDSAPAGSGSTETTGGAKAEKGGFAARIGRLAAGLRQHLLLILLIVFLLAALIALLIILLTRRSRKERAKAARPVRQAERATAAKSTAAPAHTAGRQPAAAPLPAFSDTRCCICGQVLGEDFKVFLRAKDGRESRVDPGCYGQLNILRSGEDAQEIRQAQAFVRSRLGGVDPLIAERLTKLSDSADEYLAGR